MENAEARAPREAPDSRGAYLHFKGIPTRWMDNDVYGHVNNVVYYSYFDTVVNEYLIRSGVLDIEKGAVIGLVVETGCRYFAPVTFPDTVHAGLRVARLGTSSVRYEVGLFTGTTRRPPPRKATSSTSTSSASPARPPPYRNNCERRWSG